MLLLLLKVPMKYFSQKAQGAPSVIRSWGLHFQAHLTDSKANAAEPWEGAPLTWGRRGPLWRSRTCRGSHGARGWGTLGLQALGRLLLLATGLQFGWRVWQKTMPKLVNSQLGHAHPSKAFLTASSSQREDNQTPALETMIQEISLRERKQEECTSDEKKPFPKPKHLPHVL